MVTKLNKIWHEQNKMPEHPSPEQRAKWHIEHLQYCGCRKPTPGIQKLINNYRKTNHD